MKSSKLNFWAAQGGFTLVEIMVAMAVFTIASVGLISMQLTTINGNKTSFRYAGGSTWAADRIERLLALPFANAAFVDANANGIAGLNDTAAPDQTITSDDGIYTLFWNVAPGYPVAGLDTVRVLAQTNDAGFVRTVTYDFIKGPL